MRLEQIIGAIERGDVILIRRDNRWLRVMPKDTTWYFDSKIEDATTLLYLEDLAGCQWSWEPRQYTASEIVAIWRKEPERQFRPVECEECAWDAQFGLLEMEKYLNSKWVDVISAATHPGGWKR